MGILQKMQPPKASLIAKLLVFKAVYQYYPRKSFVSGLWLRDFEKTELFLNCFTNILDPKEYPYFRHYLKNIVLTTPGERALWMQASEEERINYALDLQSRSAGKTVVNWDKMKELVPVLIKEYKRNFPFTHKGIVAYKYSLKEQAEIIGKLNKRVLTELKS